MSQQSLKPGSSQENIELRIRTMRTLWIAMLLSIGAYFAFSVFVGRPENRNPNGNLSLILLAGALLMVVLSFIIKSKLLSTAIERQQVPMVQQAYVASWAIAEVAALLGLLDFFLTNNRYYYLLFIVAACGQLLHFPRRDDVMNAAAPR